MSLARPCDEQALQETVFADYSKKWTKLPLVPEKFRCQESFEKSLFAEAQISQSNSYQGYDGETGKHYHPERKIKAEVFQIISWDCAHICFKTTTIMITKHRGQQLGEFQVMKFKFLISDIKWPIDN